MLLNLNVSCLVDLQAVGLPLMWEPNSDEFSVVS
jgi:hypothetical protein